MDFTIHEFVTTEILHFFIFIRPTWKIITKIYIVTYLDWTRLSTPFGKGYIPIIILFRHTMECARDKLKSLDGYYLIWSMHIYIYPLWKIPQGRRFLSGKVSSASLHLKIDSQRSMEMMSSFGTLSRDFCQNISISLRSPLRLPSLRLCERTKV